MNIYLNFEKTFLGVLDRHPPMKKKMKIVWANALHDKMINKHVKSKEIIVVNFIKKKERKKFDAKPPKTILMLEPFREQWSLSYQIKVYLEKILRWYKCLWSWWNSEWVFSQCCQEIGD